MEEERRIKLDSEDYIVMGDSRDAHKYKVLYKGKDVSKSVKGLIMMGAPSESSKLSISLKKFWDFVLQFIGVSIIILVILIALWLIFGGMMLAHDSAKAIAALGGV